MRSCLTGLLLCMLVPSAMAQQVRWLSLDEWAEARRKDPRPVVVFIHTDWCRYCALQAQNTFADPAVVALLDTGFYCVKLDAEAREDLVFLNRTYRYRATGEGTGQHELAVLLGRDGGTLVFPTTVILSAEGELVARFAGFLDGKVLAKGLNSGWP